MRRMTIFGVKQENDKDKPMTDTMPALLRCDECHKVFEINDCQYGACPHCGRGYEYNLEGHIAVLTQDDWKSMRKRKGTRMPDGTKEL